MRRLSKLVIVPTLGALLLSCSANKQPGSAKAPDEPGFVSLSKGGDSRLSGEVGEVIRDSSRWHLVWGLIPRSNPPPPAPSVDFEREMLVLAAGPVGSPGDSVVIERVTESSKGLQVRVVAYQQCSPLMMVKRPYHVVRVRRSARPPVFDNGLVRGPNCIPADPDRLKITRYPTTGIVPAEPPDTVPAWARADSSFVGPSRYISARFIRNIVVLQFRKEATQPERQRAVDVVSGTVIGGYRSTGIYLVQVADPGDGSVIVRVAEQLNALPSVLAASPDIELGLQ